MSDELSDKKWLGIFLKFIELCALIAAVITAWVIYKQFLEMRETRILDERAWVAAENPTVGAIENGSVKFFVTYKNTGKTCRCTSITHFHRTRTRSNYYALNCHTSSDLRRKNTD